jgi:hypothetical protein
MAVKYRPILLEDRAHEVAESILGTCDGLDQHATEEERDSREFSAALDDRVALCECCGWWVEADEVDRDGCCEECSDAGKK